MVIRNLIKSKQRKMLFFKKKNKSICGIDAKHFSNLMALREFENKVRTREYHECNFCSHGEDILTTSNKNL